jgi:putative ABC transport system ATP-binding protein
MIRLINISKTYVHASGPLPVLRDVSLAVDAGELCAITGVSGSGKTTLMNIIGLLDRPTSGQMAFNGVDVMHAPPDALALLRNRTIGFVFQAFHLLSRLSAIDNVALPLMYRGVPKHERRRRALTKLEAVNLADRADHKPTELSGGQQQRVAIARALVGDPAVILADEPTGNLDSGAAQDIMDLLLNLSREGGPAVVIVTHDPSIAARCPRRVIMRDGMVIHDRREPPGPLEVIS